VLLGAVFGHELVALARSVERGGEYPVMRAVELAGAIAALAEAGNVPQFRRPFDPCHQAHSSR